MQLVERIAAQERLDDAPYLWNALSESGSLSMNASRAVFVFVRASRASGASAVESGGGFSACHSLITQSLNLM